MRPGSVAPRSGPPRPGAARLALAVDDEAAGGIVGRDRDGHAIAEHHADAVAAHLAGQLGEHFVPVLQLDAEVTALGDEDDFALEVYELFLTHRTPGPVT